MFGDGTGDNLKGITRYEGVDCVSKFIAGNYVTISAGAIESLELQTARQS